MRVGVVVAVVTTTTKGLRWSEGRGGGDIYKTEADLIFQGNARRTNNACNSFRFVISSNSFVIFLDFFDWLFFRILSLLLLLPLFITTGNALWKSNDPINPTILHLNQQHPYLISSINHGKSEYKLIYYTSRRTIPTAHIDWSIMLWLNIQKGLLISKTSPNLYKFIQISLNLFNFIRIFPDISEFCQIIPNLAKLFRN